MVEKEYPIKPQELLGNLLLRFPPKIGAFFLPLCYLLRDFFTSLDPKARRALLFGCPLAVGVVRSGGSPKHRRRAFIWYPFGV